MKPFITAFLAALVTVAVGSVVLYLLQKDNGFIEDTCGPVVWDRSSLPIPVYVDGNAIGPWFTAVQDAMALWDPSEQIFAFEGVLIETATVTDPVIIVRAEQIDDHGKSRLRWNARCELRRVDMTLPDLVEAPFLRRRATAHEFGHALGFDHDTIGTSVMFPKALSILPFGVTIDDRDRLGLKYGPPASWTLGPADGAPALTP